MNGFATLKQISQICRFTDPASSSLTLAQKQQFRVGGFFSKAAEQRRTPGRIRVTAGTPYKARNSRVASRVPDYFFLTLLTF
jgi:hypothetical protein